MILVRDNSGLNIESIKSNTISLPFHNFKQPSIQNYRGTQR